MPSSPRGPCTSGNTTTLVGSGPAASSARRGSGSQAGPLGSSRSGRVLVAKASTAVSAIDHRPLRSRPTGMISYRVASAAASTWRADTHDTSCSALRPPNRTTRRLRLGIPAS